MTNERNIGILSKLDRQSIAFISIRHTFTLLFSPYIFTMEKHKQGDVQYMAFTDLNFLSRFLPLFIIVFFLSPRRFQTVELFVASLLFYSFGDFRSLPVLLALCGVNYLFAKVSVEQEGTEGRHFILAGIVALDACTLLIFKLLLLIFGWRLPLGISFYIFKMLSFQIDVYRGTIKKLPGVLETAAYFTLFFQIAQGPIMRYSKKEFQPARHRLSLVRLEKGLKIMILGICMKALIADRLAILWNEAEKIGFESLSTPLAWLVAFGYSLQLYLDFWGYSLIAAGIGVMLGFSYIENFSHPYAAVSVGEFYRRWHVTLTSWFRDYVYIPLGGSRNGQKRTVLNILIVWLLTGFWHGGGLHFVLWGLVLGIFICAEKLFLLKALQKIPLIGHIYVWLVIPCTWMLFAPDSIGDVLTLFGRMFPLSGHTAGASAGDFPKYLKLFLPYILASGLLCVPKVYDFIAAERSEKGRLAESVILVALLWISLYRFDVSQANPFLYFNF